jgi:hypothetical protein
MESPMQQIIGLNLNIDQKYVTDVVKQSVLLAIANAVDTEKTGIVNGVVNAVLTTMVKRENGAKAEDYDVRNGRACTLIEYYVRNIISDLIKGELQSIIESKRDDFRKLLLEGLSKKENQKNLVNGFLDSLVQNAKSTYCTKVNVGFERAKD